MDHGIHRQEGAVLVISLIFLAILTLLAVSGMETALMEEKMAGHFRDRGLAFEAAEAAVRDAEALIENQSKNAVDSWTDIAGLYGATSEAPDYHALATWTDAQEGSAIDGVASNPRFVVEHVEDISGSEKTLNIASYGALKGAGTTSIFRITARGTGATDNAVVMIQTYYGRRF